jgi:hypothetical protein
MILGNSHCKPSHGLTIRTRTELVMQGQVSRGYRQRSVRQRNLSVVTEDSSLCLMMSVMADASLAISYYSLAQNRPNKTDGDSGDFSGDLVMLLVRPVTYSDCLRRSGWPGLDKNFSSAERYLQN